MYNNNGRKNRYKKPIFIFFFLFADSFAVDVDTRRVQQCLELPNPQRRRSTSPPPTTMTIHFGTKNHSPPVFDRLPGEIFCRAFKIRVIFFFNYYLPVYPCSQIPCPSSYNTGYKAVTIIQTVFFRTKKIHDSLLMERYIKLCVCFFPLFCTKNMILNKYHRSILTSNTALKYFNFFFQRKRH